MHGISCWTSAAEWVWTKQYLFTVVQTETQLIFQRNQKTGHRWRHSGIIAFIAKQCICNWFSPFQSYLSITNKNLWKKDCNQRRAKTFSLLLSVPLFRVFMYVGVTANSVHPGIVMTEVMRHYPLIVRCLFNFIGFFFFKVSALLRFTTCNSLCQAKCDWLMVKNDLLLYKNTLTHLAECTV